MLVEYLQAWKVVMNAWSIVMDYLNYNAFVRCLKCFEVVCSLIAIILLICE